MAKLNDNYYEKDINYDNITEKEEEDIINYINKYNESEYNKIFENDIRTNIFISLSEIRKNIINWYDFKANSNILEIGAEFGSITGELCKKAKNVTSIEFKKNRAEAICKRHYDKENLEVIVGSILNIKFEQKYDYIILFGMIENYKLFGFKNLEEFLIYIKNNLKDNGTLLIATDNKLGIKEIVSFNINNNIKELYTKQNLDDSISKVFDKYKYYYPLPDYRLANVIYSDSYLPDPNDSKIRYNKYYNEDVKIVKDELEVVKDIVQNNSFKEFTNSYLIEVNNSSKIDFISFNNMRKKEYKLSTIIDSNKVKKLPLYEESIVQINSIKNNIEILEKLGFDVLDKYSNESIISEFVKYEKLDKIIVDNILNNNIESAITIINNYFEYLKSNLIKSVESKNYLIINNIDYSNINDFNFINNGFIDLTFENVFINENKYIIFDQEWCLNDIPIEFILYRTINNMYCYNPEIENILSKKSILEKFDLYKYLDIFLEIEKTIQNSIVDISNLAFYSRNIGESLNIWINNKNIDYQNKINNEIQMSKEKIDAIIMQKDGEISILKDELEGIKDSRSYKFVKSIKNMLGKK